MRPAFLTVLFVSLLGGCTKSHQTHPDGSVRLDCSVDATDPSLPGVSIHVEADDCTFGVGEGGEFRYRVSVASPIDYSVTAGMSCGACFTYSSDPANLVSYVIGAGAVRYCRCDVGCCPPNEAASYTLGAATVDGTIEWPGRQWNGPSDTVNPLGDPFPPGEYATSVTLAVPGVGSVTADLPIIVR